MSGQPQGCGAQYSRLLLQLASVGAVDNGAHLLGLAVVLRLLACEGTWAVCEVLFVCDEPLLVSHFVDSDFFQPIVDFKKTGSSEERVASSTNIT